MTFSIARLDPFLRSRFLNASFVALLSLALIVVPVVGLSGCNQTAFQQTMSKIAAYLPVAFNAANGIVAILVTAGVLTAAASNSPNSVEQEITNDFDVLCGTDSATTGKCDAASLVGVYLASPTSTTFEKITAVLNDLQTNLKSVLTVFHVASVKTQATITAAVSFVLSTLAALQAQFPTVAAQLKAGATSVKFSMPYSPSGFANQFNSIVTSGGFANAAIK